MLAGTCSLNPFSVECNVPLGIVPMLRIDSGHCGKFNHSHLMKRGEVTLKTDSMVGESLLRL